MALHLPIGPLKPALGWSRYRDAILVPTSPLADDIAIGAGFVFVFFKQHVTVYMH